MSARATLPWLVRVLLRCLPLGDRRDDVTADISDLYASRLAERGRVHAYSRVWLDVASVAAPHRAITRVLSSDRVGGIESCLLDLRYGLRLFRKHPAVIGAAVAGLALAIGVGTSVFTLLNATVMRPYGMDDPSSVVRVQMRLKGGVATEWPYRGFMELAERARQSRIVATSSESVRIAPTANAEADRVDALQLVSGPYMTVLGGRAALGRLLLPSDDTPSASPAIVLNHRFWTTRLSADRTIVGKTLWLSGHAATVVGVIDADFTGPSDQPPAAWTTFGSYGAIFGVRPIDRSSDTPVSVIARVAPGVAREVAERELSAIAAALPDVGIRSAPGALVPAAGVRLDGAASPLDGRDAGTGLMVISAILFVIGLVLALACANVANLLLAGATVRGREISLRLALGAPRGRIVRQLLTESVFIGALAGGLGLLLSMMLVPVAARTMGLADSYDVTPDLHVVLFAVFTALASGLAAGVSPARHGAHGDLIGPLKLQGADGAGGPRVGRARRLFVGFQAAASTLLLVTAALFGRATMDLLRIHLGFDADRLVGVVAAFPRSGFEAAAADDYWRSAQERVRALPSVQQVALTSSLPFDTDLSVRVVDRMAQRGVEYLIFHQRISPEYFSTAGLRLIRGRVFETDDMRSDAPVAIVSRSVARDFFGDADPIGASLSAVSDDLRSLRVIGVVDDAVTARLRGRGNGVIYQPMTAARMGAARLLVRSAHPELVVHDLEAALRSVDPRVRPDARLVREGLDEYMTAPKIMAGASAAIALVAVALAILGMFGVSAFIASQRLREMQVRRAIGASASDLAALLTRQSLTPVGVGVVVGLAIVLPAARVLAPVLSGLSPYDPAAIVGSVLVIAVSAAAAVVMPALRAARVDPTSLLRA